MSVTNDYKNLTLADRSAIRIALGLRQKHLEELITMAESMRTTWASSDYDRLRTQLAGELEQNKAAQAKVVL
ncbi:hypothetical protein [Duganella sp. BuS-21]|uniref:hypothetical protein n=1 Tax=Duganella sp. BuS-21 TaxID=2943848 RepID=UPI0035A59952